MDPPFVIKQVDFIKNVVCNPYKKAFFALTYATFTSVQKRCTYELYCIKEAKKKIFLH